MPIFWLAPTFIGCVLACFGAYWALSLGLTWFTPFVVKGLGFPQSSADGSPRCHGSRGHAP